MQITTAAFQNDEMIPRDDTGDGKDVSPALSWDAAPTGTQSFALTCTDPDAPRGTFTHWVVFNIPADRHQLPEGVPGEKEVLDGVRQGKNDFGKIGYNGPKPPPGKPHRYYFTLYALDTKLDLPAGSNREELEKAMKGHIRAQGQVMGKYQR